MIGSIDLHDSLYCLGSLWTEGSLTILGSIGLVGLALVTLVLSLSSARSVWTVLSLPSGLVYRGLRRRDEVYVAQVSDRIRERRLLLEDTLVHLVM